MNYKEAREYLESTNRYGSVLGLNTIKELLKRIDNPQDKLKVVHFAGTNGKGSVGAYLESIMIKALPNFCHLACISLSDSESL